jgi:hypothetical protein
VPNERTFRLNVERCVANGLLLKQADLSADFQEISSDDAEVRENAYLLTLFEQLRTNPTEACNVAEDATPGLGLTSKALENAVTRFLSQPGYEDWSREKMDRHCRLFFTKELVAVGDVFLRLPTSTADRTWQQENVAYVEADADQSQAEGAAIGESGAGGKAGTIGRKRKAADAEAGEEPSKYQKSRPSTKTDFAREAKLANKEKATTAFQVIVKPESYKDDNKGELALGVGRGHTGGDGGALLAGGR